jgi:hypothetical protein
MALTRRQPAATSAGGCLLVSVTVTFRSSPMRAESPGRRRENLGRVD